MPAGETNTSQVSKTYTSRTIKVKQDAGGKEHLCINETVTQYTLPIDSPRFLVTSAEAEPYQEPCTVDISGLPVIYENLTTAEKETYPSVQAFVKKYAPDKLSSTFSVKMPEKIPGKIDTTYIPCDVDESKSLDDREKVEFKASIKVPEKPRHWMLAYSFEVSLTTEGEPVLKAVPSQHVVNGVPQEILPYHLNALIEGEFLPFTTSKLEAKPLTEADIEHIEADNPALGAVVRNQGYFVIYREVANVSRFSAVRMGVKGQSLDNLKLECAIHGHCYGAPYPEGLFAANKEEFTSETREITYPVVTSGLYCPPIKQDLGRYVSKGGSGDAIYETTFTQQTSRAVRTLSTWVGGPFCAVFLSPTMGGSPELCLERAKRFRDIYPFISRAEEFTADSEEKVSESAEALAGAGSAAAVGAEALAGAGSAAAVSAEALAGAGSVAAVGGTPTVELDPDKAILLVKRVLPGAEIINGRFHAQFAQYLGERILPLEAYFKTWAYFITLGESALKFAESSKVFRDQIRGMAAKAGDFSAQSPDYASGIPMQVEPAAAEKEEKLLVDLTGHRNFPAVHCTVDGKMLLLDEKYIRRLLQASAPDFYKLKKSAQSVIAQ